MTDPPDWTPDPQLVAAYLDGELTDRPDLRARVAAWLAAHPDEAESHRRLVQLWRETAPAEPSAAAWQRTLDGIRRQRPVPARRTRLALLGAAAAACVAALLLWASWPSPTLVPPAVEVFPVAAAGEVTILRIQGDDIGTLVVGTLPVEGPLELAVPGEVLVMSVQPDADDQMMPRVRVRGPHRPMVYAKLDEEE